MVKRALLAACTLAATHLTDAFSYNTSPTVAVPASKRLSADQQFATTWEIRSSQAMFPITGLYIHLPGRVFISYTDNTSSDASADSGDLFGRVKISGSSPELLARVTVAGTTGSLYADEEVQVRMVDSEEIPPGALLVEVELLRKNAVNSVVMYGLKARSCDIVVLENVLYSKAQDPTLGAAGMKRDRGITLQNTDGIGTIFVSDKSSTLVVNDLEVKSARNGGIQIEVGGLKVNGTTRLRSSVASNVTLFADALDFAHEVQVDIVSFAERPELTNGKTCISSSSKVNVTVPSQAEAYVSYPGMSTGAVVCTKQELPKRVPVQVGKQGSGSGATPETAGSAAASWRGMSALMVLLTALSTSFLLAAL